MEIVRLAKRGDKNKKKVGSKGQGSSQEPWGWDRGEGIDKRFLKPKKSWLGGDGSPNVNNSGKCLPAKDQKIGGIMGGRGKGGPRKALEGRKNQDLGFASNGKRGSGKP